MSSSDLTVSIENQEAFSDGVFQRNSTKDWDLSQFPEAEEIDLNSDNCTAIIKVAARSQHQHESYDLHRIANVSNRLAIRQIDPEIICFTILDHRLSQYPSARFGLSQNTKRGEHLSWLRLFEASEEASPKQDEITDVFKYLNGMISEKRLSDVDHLLFLLGNIRMSLELKAAILRFTYPKKDEFRAWNSAVDNIQDKIKSKGDNPKDLLFGLI
ncbi:hypothetical protein [Thalassospira lucentensis]|uniref:hypothetical protein n=1 Tax=Thalassospira lucentensis TaxID=168935 RepID=UPI00142E08B7|nr:hypothetical protein [Thalassospira lucentensis]NIZ00661.1 hypothetical protein [Thalassospira lucentensis]